MPLKLDCVILIQFLVICDALQTRTRTGPGVGGALGVGGVGAGPFLFYVLASLTVHMGMLMQSKLELCVCFPFHC